MDRNQTGHGSLMALSCLSYADSFQARLTSRATFLLHATARYVPVRPQSTYPKGLATLLATSICEHPLPFLCACIETSFRVNDILTAPFAVASPYKLHNMSSAEPFTLLSIGLVTIIVRIYFRWRSVGPANWQIDDYLMPLTGVSYPACDSVRLIHTLVIRAFTNIDTNILQLLFTAEVVAAYLVGAKFGGLTNSYMTPQERADLDVDSDEHYNRVMGSKVQVIGWSLYAAILWCLKVCVTALYGRLTYVHQSHPWIV
jgi:hypothetical protein